ncbi:hypothetical protein M9H77_25486 [Catharanthus roseus]|uniref:Uncharacterized protein n=1 Tax=Catharanthus roseus TaxID=4058 RepID=A0ACC0AB86_CATRO|nr:hypothetical protein M9H77_25486 [Catharanthus roseus]
MLSFSVSIFGSYRLFLDILVTSIPEDLETSISDRTACTGWSSHACLDMKTIYLLVLAMQSRMLIMTLDENLKPLSVAAVSVGEAAAVDVIYWWEAEAE